IVHVNVAGVSHGPGALGDHVDVHEVDAVKIEGGAVQAVDFGGTAAVGAGDVGELIAVFVITVDGDDVVDVGDGDVVEGDVLDLAAVFGGWGGAIAGFEVNSVAEFGDTVHGDVVDEHAVEAGVGLSADGDAVAVGDGAVLDVDVAGVGVGGLGDDVVVAVGDIAVLNEEIGSGKVDAVGVGHDRFVLNRDVVDEDVGVALDVE